MDDTNDCISRMFLQTMETILADDPDAIDIRRGGQQFNHYTFFVPTDSAFRSLGSARLRRLQSDQTYMTKVGSNSVSNLQKPQIFKNCVLFETGN